MNNTFNIRRFGLLLQKHWMEKRKYYLTGLGAYTVIMLVIYTIEVLSYDAVTKHNQDFQASNYISALFIGGVIYAALMFTDYTRKETGIFNLLLPASQLEKALVYILYGVFFYWVAFSCCFVLVDIIIFQFIKTGDTFAIFSPLKNRQGSDINLYIVYAMFLFSQGLFVLGSIYFRRFSFFKTSVAVLILFLLIIPMVTDIEDGDRILKYNVINMTSSLSTHVSDSKYVTHKDTIAELSPGITSLVFGAGILIYAGLCSVIYLRLKEKQL
jgi:hypothetical protein